MICVRALGVVALEEFVWGDFDLWQRKKSVYENRKRGRRGMNTHILRRKRFEMIPRNFKDFGLPLQQPYPPSDRLIAAFTSRT